MSDRRPERARDDRRLLVAGLAGLAAGALLVRRSVGWLAVGAGLGLIAGRRLAGGDRDDAQEDARDAEDGR